KKHLFEQCGGPLPLEDFFRRIGRRRQMEELFFNRIIVEGDTFETTAAFLCLSAPPIIGHEMFQRGEEKGAKLAFGAVGGDQIVFVEDLFEKALSQILGIMRRVTAPADKDVKGIPVVAAELFKRLMGRWRSTLRCGEEN